MLEYIFYFVPNHYLALYIYTQNSFHTGVAKAIYNIYKCIYKCKYYTQAGNSSRPYVYLAVNCLVGYGLTALSAQ